MKFYLGTHMDNWLFGGQVDYPLFISARRLRRRKGAPKALVPWALDSGGFSELSMYGGWQTTPEAYVAEVTKWQGQGLMDWAAIQDWMCEPDMLEKTGKTVEEHQELTVKSMLTLTSLVPDVPWMPVLQGWEPDDYLAHLEMYREAGVYNTSFGIGSVCRRQATGGVEGVIKELASGGIGLHAFGFKTRGLTTPGMVEALESSDSMAWSFDARRADPLEGCTHKNCANCHLYATRWRDRLMRRL